MSGTLIPQLFLVAFDANGLRVANAKARFFLAGLATPVVVYTNKALTVAAAVPLSADASGNFPQLWLTPGTPIKVDVRDALESASLPNYPCDNIDPVPTASGNVEATWTAGEAISAGNAAYISDGSGGKTPGLAYKADSTNAYSSTLPEVGIALADVAINVAGTFRKGGQITVAGLAAGSPYYVGAAGAITVTPPSLARRLGQAISATVLDLSCDPPAGAGGYDFAQLQIFG